MQAGAERRHHVDARLGVELFSKRVEALAAAGADDIGRQVRGLDDLFDRAVRQQFAVGDVGDLVAALGLVHVVGRDQHREALGGERVDLVPELAPRLRIDAGGRLVEQQQFRARQRAGAERQPLLPAAGQLAGELLLAAGQAEPFDGGARCGDRLRDAVDAADELEILAHRQVLIQAEALRHVADLALDLVGLGADVVAEAGAGAFIRRQQAAQHADRGRLAGAVRAEEAVDRAALDLHREVAHHRAAVEFFGQAVHIDDDIGRRSFRRSLRQT